MTKENLVQALGELDTSPHDSRVRKRVDLALKEVADAGLLAEVLTQFPVELEVALAVEHRLSQLGVDHPDALARIARVRATYADDSDLWEQAYALTQRALTIDENNVIALETAILLHAFKPDASESQLDAWSQRYIELRPFDLRALSARVKVLLKFGHRNEALEFLQGIIVVCEQTTVQDVAESLRHLRNQIVAGDNVLQQWP